MDFCSIDPKTYDKNTFGKCIKQQREDEGLTRKTVAENAGISPAYLADIEKGNRQAPKEKILLKIAEVLSIKKEDLRYFFAMAGATKGEFKDITDYLLRNTKAIVFMRYAIALKLTDQEWGGFIKYLDGINKDNDETTQNPIRLTPKT